MPALTAEEVYDRYVRPMSPSEREQLAAMLTSVGEAREGAQHYDWAGIRGSPACPATGQDAQS